MNNQSNSLITFADTLISINTADKFTTSFANSSKSFQHPKHINVYLGSKDRLYWLTHSSSCTLLYSHQSHSNKWIWLIFSIFIIISPTIPRSILHCSWRLSKGLKLPRSSSISMPISINFLLYTHASIFCIALIVTLLKNCQQEYYSNCKSFISSKKYQAKESTRKCLPKLYFQPSFNWFIRQCCLKLT